MQRVVIFFTKCCEYVYDIGPISCPLLGVPSIQIYECYDRKYKDYVYRKKLVQEYLKK